MLRRLVPCLMAAFFVVSLFALVSPPAASAKTIKLVGASQFDEKHAFTRCMRKFEELVKEYYGKPIEFEMHLNSELGLEKDYFAYMNQGISVDYAVVAPSHMSTFSKAAPFMDMPFLFKGVDHWTKVMQGEPFAAIADEVLKKADVRLIGYAGGGVRNLICKNPVTDMATLKGLKIRVMGAPIQTWMFQAIGAAPTVIAYAEVYNAMQTGVIDAAENEAAGIMQMKFYEVGPDICQTQHAITVRPLCFSNKTFQRLPEDLQTAITKAGKEAGDYGRQLESSEDAGKLDQMVQEDKIKLYDFTERDAMVEKAAPVRIKYAKEIGAEAVLQAVDAID